MEVNVYRNLMRVFFQYQTDTLLCIQDKSILGTIDKRIIEGLMSDMSHTKINQEIPIHKILKPEEALEALLNRGITVNDQKHLPVVDNQGTFIGLWSKSEILESAISQQNASTSLNPSSESGEENVLSPEDKFAREYINDNIKQSTITPVKPEVRFQISSAPEGKKENSTSPQNHIKSDVDKTGLPDVDYMSIKTLEALPIPMLAVDTKGEVLFYNQDWVNLQQLNKETLGVNRLMRVSKDIMAKLAFDGELEIDSILILPDAPKGYNLKMRSILADQDSRPRVMGYIFWVEHNVSESPISQKKASTKNSVAPSTSENTSGTGKSYTGKTLIELLEIEEKKIIQWAMDETDHNQSNAAMLLGIPRQTFSYRYHRLFDEKPSKKPTKQKK